jgi:hypothetical protein
VTASFDPMSFSCCPNIDIFLRMPSPKGPSPDDLEEQAKALERLIEDAQSLQHEITEHLRRVRRENRSAGQPIVERRKRPR